MNVSLSADYLLRHVHGIVACADGHGTDTATRLSNQACHDCLWQNSNNTIYHNTVSNNGFRCWKIEPASMLGDALIDLFENSFWQAIFRGIVQAMPHK